MPAKEKYLTKYIKKNTVINNFLNQMPDAITQKKLYALQQAIAHGDSAAIIWNDENCDLYLIYLIEKEEIPYWEGITAYVYLIAKMQYTSTQNLRTEDQKDTKLNYRVEIQPLTKSGKITKPGEDYLANVCQAMQKIDFTIDLEELKTYVVTLSPIEQWLLKTEFNKKAAHDSDKLINILISNLPFLQTIKNPDTKSAYTPYFIPSLSLINFLKEKMDSEPMQTQPILGSIGSKILYEHHKKNSHPTAIYARHVKSNYKKVHTFRCGPLGILLHDLGHAFWACMLSFSERNFIFETYIPALKCLEEEEASKYEDINTVSLLQRAILKAYDFDLTNIGAFAKKAERLAVYLARTFGRESLHPHCVYSRDPACILSIKAIGNHPSDGAFFLLNKYAPTIKPFNIILKCIPTGDNYRSEKVVNALRTVAQHSEKFSDKLIAMEYNVFYSKCNSKKSPINWLAWLGLLNSAKNSEEIWKSIISNNERADELTYMLANGLIFFHPYLPLTKAKIVEFRTLIDYIINENLSEENLQNQPTNIPLSLLFKMPRQSTDSDEDTNHNTFRSVFIR